MTDEQTKQDQEQPQEQPIEQTPTEPVQESVAEVKTEQEPLVAEQTEAQKAVALAEQEELKKLKGSEIATEDIRPGMVVSVHERIIDVSPKGEERERIQVFQGRVMGLRGSKESRTMIIRKIGAGGIGVEKIYPVHSPNVSKVELLKTTKVRKAKLNFLRGFKRRFKEKIVGR
ncbi:MAG: 50S ribosomal protein L19 [uncultured bacterium]|nr:MAG: 50S ribosomal protein L19 [uncultured bacterium]HBD05538.1 hypothetical protein [Candidatus Uhrbacteria bacterium]